MIARRTARLFPAIVLCFTLALAASATVKIVGDPTPDYIQITNAIRYAAPGDVIRVSTGTYVEVFNVWSKSLTIDGKYDTGCVSKVVGVTELTLPGPVFPPVLWIEDSDALLIDLDITGGIPAGSAAIQGGGVYLTDASNVRMEGCRVYNNRANGYGGGIYVTNSSLTLTNCLVFSNRAIKALSGAYQPEGRGGGIAVNNGYLEIFGEAAGGTDSSIKWNTADHMGGGIYVDNGSWAILSSETADVLYNSATNGGGIAVVDLSYLAVGGGADVAGNFASDAGGGILLAGGSTGIVYGGQTYVGYNASSLGPNIASNAAGLAVGGGIAVHQSSLIVESFACVAHNTASRAGGGIYVSNGYCRIDNASVGNPYNSSHTNQADSGGGVHVVYNSTLVLTNGAVIKGNRANFFYGGGLYAYRASIRFDDSAIYSNTALGSHGGGIYLLSSSFTGRQARVYGNRCFGENGGGWYAYRCAGLLDTVSFSNNWVAGDGGAMAWEGISSDLLTITGDSRIWRNSAENNGGGLWVAGAPVSMSDGWFRSNTASNDGGGLCISNAVVDLESCSFEYNRADADDDGGGDGGAIWVGYGGSFRADARHSLTVVDANQAVNGGGFFIAPNSTGTLGQLQYVYRVSNNRAKENGGGIAVMGGELSVTDKLWCTENVALSDGGGIYAYQSVVRLHGDVLVGDVDPTEGNIAGNYGGGMALNLSTLFASDVILLNNTATNFSGGMDAVASFLFGTNLLFSGNRALLQDAGGLYGENSRAILRNTILTNNFASGQGGGICWIGDNLALTDSRIGDNRSQTAGGILLSGGDAWFNQVTVSLNRATGDAGGIQMRNGSTLRSTNLVVTGNSADEDGNMVGDGGGLLIQNESGAWLYGTNSGMTLISGNRGYAGGGIMVSNGYLQVGGLARIEGNLATNGAGLYVAAGTAEVVNAYIARNEAAVDAGGVMVRTNSVLALRNSALAENIVGPLRWGGGLYNRGGNAVLISCTVFSNAVAGIDCESGSSLDVGGSIVHGHSIVNVTPGYNVQYSDVQDGYVGLGNFDAPPLLLAGNYHLSAWSPCRDAGWAAVGERDVDGELRAGNVDVGFDEYVDGDNDNLPDIVETGTGIWVGDADMGTDPGSDDSDGDGIKDGEEWMADTDPNNDQAFLRFTAIYSHAGGGCAVTWVGGTNANQYLEIARDFTTTNDPNLQIYSTRFSPTPSPGSDAMTLVTNAALRIRARKPGF